MKKYSIEEVKASFSFSVPLQVRFSDIDGYMHVNNGIYFNYFEHARAQYLFQICNWNIMDVGTVVANVNLDYYSPIHALDLPVAYVRVSKIGNTSFTMEQVILGKTGQGEEIVFASATVTMVSVNMKTMKPVPVPEEYVSKMKKSTPSAG
ncbi:putative thioesterase [Belliella baltica DSM 15883]|uniref:Putative thioesterase n=1 Tax=Belliella baltica (strain DSM 15883 / CIP 108006 / LMG 21964 / BA134) TaxID=866536 RepID=I3Z1C1_BELBD|nr:thioesterase family protein [Belliella baltica]AFL83039.1 putative thioesterase [Belliella baltica DSM 15883]